MRLFIVSDTHGKLDRTKEMYDRIRSGVRFDLLIHCGDYQKDAEALSRLLQLPVVSVPGNCDGCLTQAFETVDLPSGRLLVTHGHMENVRESHEGLVRLAEETGCNAICFGHTHIAEILSIDGIDIVNPGSLTRPLDGSGGTCAAAVSSEQGFTAELFYYNDAHPQQKKKKPSGGFLRSIMNYSDGQ